MSFDLRQYIRENLIDPLKNQSTYTQETLVELITQRLEEIQRAAEEFPDLVNPEKVREHMLEELGKSFAYDLDPRMSVEEQRKVLSHIVETYKRRGSIETIENMWKYYGGNLPKNVKVVIPAYNLFRYSVSKLSGKDRFKDGSYYRSGAYEMIIEDDIDIQSIKEFVLKELVAAGTNVLFSKKAILDITDASAFKNYEPLNNQLLQNLFINMQSVTYRAGLVYSSNTLNRSLSGRQSLFMDISRIFEDYGMTTRSQENSFFKHDPMRDVVYVPNPEEPPINILSGLPLLPLTREITLDLLGQKSLFSDGYSYDYQPPATRTRWYTRLPQMSSFGTMSGKNSLSGSPYAGPKDRSGRGMLRTPGYVHQRWENTTIPPEIVQVQGSLAELLISEKSRTTMSEFMAKYDYSANRGTPDLIVQGFDKHGAPKELVGFPGFFIAQDHILGVSYPGLQRDYESDAKYVDILSKVYYTVERILDMKDVDSSHEAKEMIRDAVIEMLLVGEDSPYTVDPKVDNSELSLYDADDNKLVDERDFPGLFVAGVDTLSKYYVDIGRNLSKFIYLPKTLVRTMQSARDEQFITKEMRAEQIMEVKDVSLTHMTESYVNSDFSATVTHD